MKRGLSLPVWGSNLFWIADVSSRDETKINAMQRMCFIECEEDQTQELIRFEVLPTSITSHPYSSHLRQTYTAVEPATDHYSIQNLTRDHQRSQDGKPLDDIGPEKGPILKSYCVL